jgi:hypothetical protein
VKVEKVKLLFDQYQQIIEPKEDYLDIYSKGEIKEEISEEMLFFEIENFGSKDLREKMDEFRKKLDDVKKPVKLDINSEYDQPFFDRAEEVLKKVAIEFLEPQVKSFSNKWDLLQKTVNILANQAWKGIEREGYKRAMKDKWMKNVVCNQVLEKHVNNVLLELMEKEESMIDAQINWREEEEIEEGTEEEEEKIQNEEGNQENLEVQEDDEKKRNQKRKREKSSHGRRKQTEDERKREEDRKKTEGRLNQIYRPNNKKSNN